MNLSKLQLGFRFLALGSAWANEAMADGEIDLKDGQRLITEVFGMLADASEDSRVRLGLDMAAVATAWAARAGGDGKITAAEVRQLLQKLEGAAKANGVDLALQVKAKKARPARLRAGALRRGKPAPKKPKATTPRVGKQNGRAGDRA